MQYVNHVYLKRKDSSKHSKTLIIVNWNGAEMTCKRLLERKQPREKFPKRNVSRNGRPMENTIERQHGSYSYYSLNIISPKKRNINS